MHFIRVFENRAAAYSVAALVALLSAAGTIARAAEDQRYQVTIAGHRFDPKDTSKLFTGQELDRHRSRPGHYLVQLHGPPNAELRAHLSGRYGFKSKEYVPNYAYVEKLDPSAAAAAATDPRIRAIVPFHPAFKLSPSIGVRKPRTPERQAIQGLLLRAELFSDADPAAIAGAISAIGGRDVTVIDDRALEGGILQVQFVVPTAERLPEIARRDDVRWIEEVAEAFDDDVKAAATLQSGNAGRPSIWNRKLHGEGQIIGIIDSELPDIDHCLLRDPADNTPGPKHRKLLQIRNASGVGTADHATFVAGNAAGDDFRDPGGHAYRGSAWASHLVVGNRADLKKTSIFKELKAAAAAGATIHSNSWHSDTGRPSEYNKLARLVDRFTWYNEEHVVLGSVGNFGEEQGPPGTSKNAIGVAATFPAPLEMSFGDGNPGPTADGRRKPDLMAPGCKVGSAKFGTACAIRHGCGTSFATPHAAGAAALVRQYFVEGWYPSGTKQAQDALKPPPSGALIKAMLLNSTVRVAGLHGYPNDWEGWGLIRLDDVLFFEGDKRRLQMWDKRNADGLETGDLRDHVVSVIDSSQPLKVTLVWTEPPPAAGVTNPVVNNLDLVVVSPAGAETFRGNVFGKNGLSATGGDADTINNVEVVLVANPASGEWVLKVQGTQVAVGNPAQGYALVVSGGLATPGGSGTATGGLPPR